MVYCRGVAIISFKLNPNLLYNSYSVYFGGNYQIAPIFGSNHYFFINNLSYQVLSELETSNNGIPQWYKHASSNIGTLGKVFLEHYLQP
jgi:hypothetical protein